MNGWRKLLVAVGVGLMAWAGATLVGHEARVSRLEAQQRLMEEWLARVEAKLDRALARK